MRYAAHTLLFSLMSLNAVLIPFFLLNDDLNHRQRLQLAYQQKRLNDKLALVQQFKQDENGLCAQMRQATVTQQYGDLRYRFHCQKVPLFVQNIAAQEKYVEYERIGDYLNLDHYRDRILFFGDLNELPRNSADNPQIAVARNALDGNLSAHFYGIIVTDYPFNIKGSFKFYGRLYSGTDNGARRDDRNIVRSKKVLDNLDLQFADWHYLPRSRNLLNNE